MHLNFKCGNYKLKINTKIGLILKCGLVYRVYYYHIMISKINIHCYKYIILSLENLTYSHAIYYFNQMIVCRLLIL